MTNENAHCMSCKLGWTREMLHGCGLSSKFVKRVYKKRREDVLFERERGMMPSTQPYVEKRIAIASHLKQIEELNKQKIPINADINANQSLTVHEISEIIGDDNYNECILWRIDKYHEIVYTLVRINNEINRLTARMTYLESSNVDVKKEARKFVRACPVNNCKGFLSQVWKCGICETWTCPECHEVKGDSRDSPHVCNHDNVETAKLLARDTKPCPKCASMIFKIEGCDQMWCPQCATAFSWRTGTIEHGRIHNPHYYEYRRANGALPREQGDIPCGGMPGHRLLEEKFRQLHIHNTYQKDPLTIIRMHNHIAAVTIPIYTRRRDDNLDIRINFMMNTINEDQFKHKIQQREKANEKKADILNILNTYQIVTSEIMQRVVTSTTFNEFVTILGEFENIRLYINDLFQKVSSRYSCVSPRILEGFMIASLK
jgi:hypothetical protein